MAVLVAVERSPPSLAGAPQVSITSPWPGVAVKSCGAPGTVAGVALVSAASLTPTRFAVRTSNA